MQAVKVEVEQGLTSWLILKVVTLNYPEPHNGCYLHHFTQHTNYWSQLH